jgi:hypothetical protein
MAQKQPKKGSALQWVIVGIAGLVLVVIAGVIVVMLWGGQFFGGNTEQVCREAIERRLVAPATAEYVEIEGGPVAYRITVDAENRMGTPLRMTFYCYTEDGEVAELLTEDEEYERTLQTIESQLE